ncbi:phage tail tape measure protein [Streptomyces huiliensis]|uniref:phage tail tape measure protein n=1 Tax=Streptomyces huiliensis TaxID=2876027 RepID=UPI001CC10535|nr:phage tail tape measure protein [Streptomyces huiliensis]MBZ4319538.1 phage tail tape measure protein [Streptomyces huiliensis]
MAVEVGVAYVSIVPEVQGFAAQLRQHVTGPSQTAGQQGGQQAGEGFTSKMGGILKGGLAGIGLAAAGLLTKGFLGALDQGAINGKLQAQLGATPAEASRYGKVAGQVYARGVTDSVEEAAQSISGVMRAGILPPDATNAQIESITSKVTDLGKTFELDIGQTSNAVGQMIKTGLAKDGTESLDLLTAAMQKMGPRADDMADTVNEYSTKFRDLGLSGAEAFGLMAQGMKAGARDTDTMADALKEFQIRATDGNKSSIEAYQALGFNAEEMTRKVAGGGKGAREGLQQVLDGIKGIKDPAEQSKVAVGLFGTKAEDLGKALLAMDPKTAVQALGDTAGAADRMGEALHSGPMARIQQLKRTVEVGLTNFFGGTVIPALMSFGRFMADTFGPVFSTAKDLVGGFLSSFSSGGGGASVAIFGETLRTLGGTLRDALLPGLQGLVTLARDTLWPALQGLGQVFVTQLVPAFMTLYSAVYSAVVPVLSSLGRIMLEVVWPAVMRIWSAILTNLQPVFASLSTFISDRVAPAVQMIGDKLRALVDKCRPLIDVIATVASWLGQFAAKILGFVIPIVIQLAGPIFSFLISAIGTVIGWIGNVIGFLGSLGSAFIGAIKWVVEFSRRAVEKMGEFLGWMRGLPGRIRDGLGDFGWLLVGKGQDLVRGIWNGVKSMGNWLKNTLINWATSVIPGPIAKALGIRSPSRVLADRVGRWIPAGVVAGIDAEQSTLDARLRAMVTVPDIGTPAPAGAVPLPRAGAVQVPGLAELLRALDADRGREIVVRVGEQEIARAVEAGQRQLARR